MIKNILNKPKKEMKFNIIKKTSIINIKQNIINTKTIN